MNNLVLTEELESQLISLDFDELLEKRNEYVNKCFKYKADTKQIIYDQITLDNIKGIIKFIDLIISNDENISHFLNAVDIEIVIPKILDDARDEVNSIYNLKVDAFYYETLKENFTKDPAFTERVTYIVDFTNELLNQFELHKNDK